MLWIVTLETSGSHGGDGRYEAVVLAHTDLAAKVAASKQVRSVRGGTTKIVSATQCDPYKTGIVALYEAYHSLVAH